MRRKYGTGHVTRKGYIRVGDGTGKSRMQHVIVWESEFGPVPDGHCIHHVNGDKQDNRIENLACLDHTTHKRIHSGCTRDASGLWHKPCGKCGVTKPITDYYERKSGVSPWCKDCCIRNAIENKRKRAAAREHAPNL